MNTIKAEIVLDDNLSPAIKKAADNVVRETKSIEMAAERGKDAMTSFSNAVAGVAAGAAALYAFKKAADVIMYFANEADGAVVAQGLLQNALGKTSVALDVQAGALQKITRYADDEIIGAQARIAAYIKDESMIKRLIPVIMDLASAKGVDLASATEIVTKSIVGEVNMLGRYGIQVKGEAKTVERFTDVVDKLGVAFGGASEVVGKAGTGPMVILKNQIGEMSKDIGVMMLPALSNWANGMQILIDKYRKMTGMSLGNPEEDLKNINVRIKAQEKESEAIAAQRKWLEKDHPFLDTSVLAEQWRMAEKISQDGLQKLYLQRSGYQKKVWELNGVSGASTADDPFADLGENSDKEKPKDKTSDAIKEYNENQRAIADIQVKWQEEEVRMRDEAVVKKAEELKSMEELQLGFTESEAKMRDDAKKKYDDQQEKEKETYKKNQELKLQASQAFFGGFSALLAVAGKKSKEAAIASKAMAITGAIIDTAFAAVKAYKSMLDVGPAGPALGAIAAAGTIAFGAAQIATISAQKFASGGVVGGNSYTGDNVPARVNSGEMILTQQQQAQLFDVANGRRGGSSVNVGGDTIIINGNADKATVKAIQQTREKQLMDLRQMIKELSYSGQMVMA